MKKLIGSAVLLGMFLAGSVLGPVALRAQAGGPASAAIQLALRSFIARTNTWTGTQTFGIGLFGNGTACTAPSISFASSTTTGFYIAGGNVLTCIGGSNVGGFDATGMVINQTTLHWTDIFMRRSAAKTLTFDTDGAGGALTNVNVQGPLTTTAALVAGTSVNANAGSGFTLVGNGAIFSTAAKLIQVTESGGTTGSELNGGTPTLGTCTGGSMTSGSHNIAGEVTGNTSGSCVINFGTPNFTNTPFCFANDETTLTAVRISARSASSITVTGAVSGDAFQFFCIGRIGT